MTRREGKFLSTNTRFIEVEQLWVVVCSFRTCVVGNWISLGVTLKCRKYVWSLLLSLQPQHIHMSEQAVVLIVLILVKHSSSVQHCYHSMCLFNSRWRVHTIERMTSRLELSLWFVLQCAVGHCGIHTWVSPNTLPNVLWVLRAFTPEADRVIN